MAWNYRVIDFGDRLEVREVYYDKGMNPELVSDSPVAIIDWKDGGGFDVEIARIKAAIEKPALDCEVFGIKRATGEAA